MTIGAVLLGYSTLAALISGQIFWLSLIGSLGYIALRLTDEVFSTLFRPGSRSVVALNRIFGLRPSSIVQFGLLVSAALQVVIILAAVTLALTPFGQSGELFVAHVRRLGAAVHIGKATISPLAVAAGVATFWVGLALSQVVRRWVVRRYLPVTGWDAGVRNSVSVGVAYLGMAVALACGLAVTGLGFRQIALIASALSVGIGFGLQQIVQNFVAGVILLIERPVKVGDWINVGGAEGGVLNIRVRATELKALDGSVVIVPNSSLITTNVQNKTPGTAHARIDLKVNVAKPADVARARDLILQLALARPQVLRAPPPEVYIDALAAAGGANLVVWVHVADAAQAARLRSDLYFDVLDAFQKAEITLL